MGAGRGIDAAPPLRPSSSGVALSGLVDVYLATGNTTILDVARTIAYAGMRDYSDPSSGVAQECEPSFPPA